MTATAHGAGTNACASMLLQWGSVVRRARHLRHALFTFLMLGLFVPAAHAEPIGLIERYALAEDRQAVLDELIPGSPEFYFYHCLHYQVTGELEQAEAKLREWETDPGAKNSSLLAGIRDRQRLLTYPTTPDRTIEYLRDRLNIELNHTASPVRGERRFPDTLAAEELAIDRLIDEALRGDKKLTRQGLRRLGERFLSNQATGLPVDLAWLLNQVDGPWIDRLHDLVTMQLRQRRPQDRRFGDLQAHRWLTLDQLQSVAEAFPEIAASDTYVTETLLRLRPDDDTDIRQQPDVWRAYLLRVDGYVSTLPAAWNSLKAAVLYRLLQSDLAEGQPHRQRFMRYLELPRNSVIVPVERRPGGSNIADLNQDYSQAALLPPIGDEGPLVRSLLEIFLKDAPSPDAFADLIRPNYLNDVFAETKLLYGVGDPERWYRLLSPAQQQQLKERVELTFSVTNPTQHDPDVQSELSVDVKNVKELVVRVYEVNTHAYYRGHSTPLNTDLDLDGLVATHQRKLEFNLPSVQRHRETLQLPEITGRGVWIVDLLGGGRRTRALIRRGELQYTLQQTIDGLEFRLLNEDREIIPSGRLQIASQEFVADESGTITIPMLAETRTQRVVLMDDQLARSVDIPQYAETYELQASFLLSEQQLLAGRTAQLAVRPRLTLNGEPISTSLLRDVALQIVSTDLDGIQSTKRITRFELDDAAESTTSFRVPARLQRLDIQLSGHVERLSNGRKQDLSASEVIVANGSDKTEATRDAYLTRRGDDWIIETRGKNGEPAADAPVTVVLSPRVRSTPVYLTFQANENGQVMLGSLPEVTDVRFGTAGSMHSRDLLVDQTAWPSRLHGVTNQRQLLAVEDSEKAPAERYRLLELRGNRPLQDVSNQLQVKDGRLQFRLATAGDYQLLDLHRNRQVSIAISGGPIHHGTAVGKARQLETRAGEAIGIAGFERDDSGVHVQLSGPTTQARVHVLASRYLPREQAITQLRLPALKPLESRFMPLRQSAYVSNMTLGEEYEYVLRRQYAQKYPGVMLPQPSLLLNPWETEATVNESQSAMAGDAPMAAPMNEPGSAKREGQAEADRRAEEASSASYHFLLDGGGLAMNLVPDADGKVHIPATVAERWPILQVVVLDSDVTIQHTLFGNLPELETRDLRLADALDADRALTFERGVLLASPDSPLPLADLGTAQLQVYASVADLLRLYSTLSADERLEPFRELGVWHTLEEAAKRELYGRLACHEVHVFLKMHDQPFFESTIRPYLEQKKEAQLIDDWLLGRDLTSWLEPWRYNRLNAMERAILAREVPTARDSILRELEEQVALMAPDQEDLRRAVDSGLWGLRLEEKASNSFQMNGAMPMDGMEIAEEEAMDLGFGRGTGAAAPQADADAFFDKQSVDRKSRRQLQSRGLARKKQFFQPLDPTKQWAESQWDHVRTAAADAELIEINRFWLDWARGQQTNGLSEHLLEPTATRHAALMALAVCGLPLKAGEVGLPEKNAEQAPPAAYVPEHPVAVITKRLVSLTAQEGDASLLVAQRFEMLGVDRPDDEKVEVQVAPEEYLTRVGYLGQVVVTNPTPQPRTVDLFWQIPEGALPLGGSLATDSATIQLEPFAVQRREYRFYFPAAGTYSHYPVCVSHDGQAIARGPERSFPVVDTPTKTDEQSWESVARVGTVEQIKTFLNNANLHRLNWLEIAPRMKDKAVYDVVTAALRSARVTMLELQAYAFHHREQAGMQTYLAQREELVRSVGPVLTSELLLVEPIERTLYEHLEYAPLIRARVHPLREQPEIFNGKFYQQYHSLMRILAFQQQPSTEQQLALSYYLLIQNRVKEAIEAFEATKPADTVMKLQRDYLAAYLALHRSDPDTAASLAAKHAQHPVPRWRERFDMLAEQLRQQQVLQDRDPLVSEEAADLAMIDRERRQANAAYEQPSLQVVADGRTLRITHRNTNEATVRLYGVDLELLFSKTPFVRDDLGRMATVRASERRTVKLEGDGITSLEIDPKFADQTLLVEVVSGSARSTALYYGGQLSTFVSEAFGQLQVSDANTRAAVSGAYVKVYGRSADGEVRFYKDGYTDLRGRFDYASLSAPELDNVQRFAILVLDPKRGASVHDVTSPTN